MKTVYKEHTIKVTDNFIFEVEELGSYQSYLEARKAIDSLIQAHVKQKKAELESSANIKMLTMLTENGEPCTIRGISAHTGLLLGPPRYSSFQANVYPNFPWLMNLLKEATTCLQRAKSIKAIIYPYAVKDRRAYGRIKPEDYEDMIKKLLQEIKEKTDLARLYDQKD